MHPEDLPDPGTYVDPETGDIWEKYSSGNWYVNGVLHRPFPHALTPEPRVPNAPAVSDEWRPVVGYPRYEVNRKGDLRYVETKTPMAPFMGDSSETYYPLMLDDHVVHAVPLSVILDQAFPESRD